MDDEMKGDPQTTEQTNPMIHVKTVEGKIAEFQQQYANMEQQLALLEQNYANQKQIAHGTLQQLAGAITALRQLLPAIPVETN